jgi:hypothetical protein
MSTEVSIDGCKFLLDGIPTYEGKIWEENAMEGLLMNSRMVQGVFDDENLETSSRWKYPDTGEWDPERNIDEFVKAMPSWRAHGLLGITVNFQGGSPEGYSKSQPWHNSGFFADGSLKPAYKNRMARILDEADKLSMVVIVGYFYFGQDCRLRDDLAIKNGAINATEWLLETGHRNVLIETNNECDIKYSRNALKAQNVHKLIELVKSIKKNSWSFKVSASFAGQRTPTNNVISSSDFVLVHGNGPENPNRIEEIVREVRASPAYRNKPIIFNEDDHLLTFRHGVILIQAKTIILMDINVLL